MFILSEPTCIGLLSLGYCTGMILEYMYRTRTCFKNLGLGPNQGAVAGVTECLGYLARV